MTAPFPVEEESARDLLVTRPDTPLPTAEDPAKPRGEPVDPKLNPEPRHGDDANAKAIDYTA